MRILSTVTRSYYGRAGATEPMFLEFTLPLARMGHDVQTFDHVAACRKLGQDGCAERFVDAVRRGGYDLVLFQTGGGDQMSRDAIVEARRVAPIVAWNSDDDWQWETYTREVSPLFTNAVTTYRHVYEANRFACPNLLLSQWGCLSDYADATRVKDLDFSFAGQVYTSRVDDCLHLKRRAGLEVFGMGSVRIRYPFFASRERYRFLARNFAWLNKPLDGYQAINDVWNRTKISYTPMGASTQATRLQIKGRAFQQGLSGTMMLTQMSPDLERFYEPDKEFIAYESIEDCAAKARFYLTHETERKRIAAAYHKRTMGEHLWEHRFAELFDQVGVGTRPMTTRAAGLAA